jgi:hypothetical protein
MPGSICLLSVILVASPPIVGGQIHRQPASGSSSTSVESAKESPSKRELGDRDNERQKLENLIRVHQFAEHIQGFRNLTAKVRALIAIADALWKQDEPYARKIFASAYDAADPDSQPHAGKDSAEEPDASKTDFGWLRREVVARIARHDAAWARALTSKEADSSRAVAYLRLARDLLQDDPKQASQYLEMGLDHNDAGEVAFVLDALRGKDPAAADALFLRWLQGLSAQPSVDPFQLLAVSSYIFLPKFDDLVVVVRGHLVFNFSGLNPLASQSAIRAYLETAVDVLSRPVPSSLAPFLLASFKESNYIVACQLLPSVRQFIPGSAPQLEAAIQGLARDIPSDLSEDAISAKLNASHQPSVTTIDEARRELDDIRDDFKHDSRCIFLSYRFFLKDDFRAAREIAGEARDLQAREKLQLLLAFEEGAKLLNRGKPAEAAAVVPRLSPGIERAVLWLAVAHKQIEGGHTKLAGTTITWALDEANRLQDPRRAVLILRAAADLAGFDPLLARQTLTEAIRTFNRVSPYSPLRMEWSELASPRAPMARFPLQPGGLDFRLARMLAPLAEIDIEGTIFDVMSLEDEDARGQGLAVLASLILEKKTGYNPGVHPGQPKSN